MEPAIEKKSQITTGTRKFVNKDLPAGYDAGNMWRRAYIPTYISFVAGYKDPWFVEDAHAVIGMQEVWDRIYINNSNITQKIPHTIVLNQAVFSIVCCFVTARSQLIGFTDKPACL
jgi:hypothetical protein